MTQRASFLKTLILAAAVAAICRQAGGAEPARQTAPAPIDRVKVDLILIDVDVRDASGRPLPGLTAADFDARVNGIRRPIYSVDDQCGCVGSAPLADRAASRSTGEESITAHDGGTPSLPTTGGEQVVEPAHFILYFDFALMDLDGRSESIAAARRWIAETMRDTDAVTIAASTYARGAATLAGPTADRKELLSTLQTMKESRDFVDPHFAFMYSRVEECEEDWADPARQSTLPNCNSNALDEYYHTRRTFKTLARYLETLDPGRRKHLILFHQIAPLVPGMIYRGARLTSTQEPVAELVGATAAAARVTIHAAGTGGAEEVAQLAAEYTGGTWNRSASDLARMLDEARNRCECLYRLGIEPLEKEKGRTVSVTVVAHDHTVANMRVIVRTDADRWIRKARFVLANPAAARDVPVHAALVPVKATASGWTVKVQVAMHASALARLPTSRGSQAEWETGARLEIEGSERAWDLLATSTMNAAVEAKGPEWIVHERTLVDLPVGTYRLGAFVRDRSVDLFGGASAALELPDPRSDAAIGPIPLLAGRRVVTVDLPLQPARGAPTRGATLAEGLVPSGDAVSDDEERGALEIMTWLCGARAPRPPGPAVERSLFYENNVVMTFPSEGEWADAGLCVRLTDSVGAGLLDDSPYRYNVRWKPPGAEPSIEVEVELP